MELTTKRLLTAVALWENIYMGYCLAYSVRNSLRVYSHETDLRVINTKNKNEANIQLS